jgi:7-carboxy-7-deazaguanine synthase
MKILRVNEIFYSIQGESTHSGRPCTFVRLTGCNLRCSYCDTRYAYDHGKTMAIEDILRRIEAYRCPLVEITGGEPLLQDATPQLIEILLTKGYEVMMETNGTFNIDWVDRRCIRIVDVKCPFSGENDKNDFENLKRLDKTDQVKFVVGTRSDYDFAKEIMKQIPREIPADQILLSPVSDKLTPATLAGWMLEDRLPARFQIQLHKSIWPGIARGV